MKRREFITLLGGAAVWPLAARAQQPAMPVVGLLSPQSLTTAGYLLEAFRKGLNELGYVEGQTVAIDYRLTEGRFDRLAEQAAELVKRKVSVIAAPGGSVAALAARRATDTIPIAFGVAEVVAKRLGLLRELVPSVSRIAVLVNPGNATNTASTLAELEAAGAALGVQIQVYKASSSREIDAAFASLASERPDAVFVGPDAFFTSRRIQLANLAARHLLPTSFSVRENVEAGGLMSYGTSLAEQYRQTGVYAGRLLRGAKPADLPVEQSIRFELVINLQTARLLDVEVPPTLLARADEVIE
jgi:putative tryptophan/tyrosine transport system substrate-binding protein